MQNMSRWTIVAGMVIAGVQFSAYQSTSIAGEKIEPAVITKIEGSDLKRVTLTQEAIKRIDLKMGAVREMLVTAQIKADGEAVGSLTQKVVPYGALIYDEHGLTWVYKNGTPRTFVRHRVKVDYIEGDLAILLEGPPLDTKVATVGVAELFGAEYGLGGH